VQKADIILQIYSEQKNHLTSKAKWLYK